jgi:hypothetical protein
LGSKKTKKSYDLPSIIADDYKLIDLNSGRQGQVTTTTTTLSEVKTTTASILATTTDESLPSPTPNPDPNFAATGRETIVNSNNEVARAPSASSATAGSNESGQPKLNWYIVGGGIGGGVLVLAGLGYWAYAANKAKKQNGEDGNDEEPEFSPETPARPPVPNVAWSDPGRPISYADSTTSSLKTPRPTSYIDDIGPDDSISVARQTMQYNDLPLRQKVLTRQEPTARVPPPPSQAPTDSATRTHFSHQGLQPRSDLSGTAWSPAMPSAYSPNEDVSPTPGSRGYQSKKSLRQLDDGASVARSHKSSSKYSPSVWNESHRSYRPPKRFESLGDDEEESTPIPPRPYRPSNPVDMYEADYDDKETLPPRPYRGSRKYDYDEEDGPYRESGDYAYNKHEDYQRGAPSYKLSSRPESQASSHQYRPRKSDFRGATMYHPYDDEVSSRTSSRKYPQGYEYEEHDLQEAPTPREDHRVSHAPSTVAQSTAAPTEVSVFRDYRKFSRQLLQE